MGHTAPGDASGGGGGDVPPSWVARSDHPGEVDPRIFSEIMRDLDLVVSVAHAGEVDPEASMSTIEARAALVLRRRRCSGWAA